MKQSSQRILTTHTGSLPRPYDLQQMLEAQDHGDPGDRAIFERQVQEAVNAIVQQEASSGIDVVNDGEMSKISYSTYVKNRLTGFGGTSQRPATAPPDVADFPEYARRMAIQLSDYKMPACNGPISYVGMEAVQRDCANLKTALQKVDVTEAFMTAASPGVIARFLDNQYYPSHEAYLFALADAMKVEYDTIYQAGFVPQLDCPDLTGNRDIPGAGKGTSYLALHIEALNHALRDIPADRMRLHLCWGNYEGPHHRDIPLRDIINSVLQARPAALSFEAANPRHEHEWKVFEEVKLPEGKILIPGVLDSTTNFIEHPELVAQRITHFTSLVGRENVIAGTDCGFATFAGFHAVDPQIAWAKLRAMVEGAQIASQELWQG